MAERTVRRRPGTRRPGARAPPRGAPPARTPRARRRASATRATARLVMLGRGLPVMKRCAAAGLEPTPTLQRTVDPATSEPGRKAFFAQRRVPRSSKRARACRAGTQLRAAVSYIQRRRHHIPRRRSGAACARRVRAGSVHRLHANDQHQARRGHARATFASALRLGESAERPTHPGVFLTAGRQLLRFRPRRLRVQGVPARDTTAVGARAGLPRALASSHTTSDWAHASTRFVPTWRDWRRRAESSSDATRRLATVSAARAENGNARRRTSGRSASTSSRLPPPPDSRLSVPATVTIRRDERHRAKNPRPATQDHRARRRRRRRAYARALSPRRETAQDGRRGLDPRGALGPRRGRDRPQPAVRRRQPLARSTPRQPRPRWPAGSRARRPRDPHRAERNARPDAASSDLCASRRDRGIDPSLRFASMSARSAATRLRPAFLASTRETPTRCPRQRRYKSSARVKRASTAEAPRAVGDRRVRESSDATGIPEDRVERLGLEARLTRRRAFPSTPSAAAKVGGARDVPSFPPSIHHRRALATPSEASAQSHTHMRRRVRPTHEASPQRRAAAASIARSDERTRSGRTRAAPFAPRVRASRPCRPRPPPPRRPPPKRPPRRVRRRPRARTPRRTTVIAAAASAATRLARDARARAAHTGVGRASAPARARERPGRAPRRASARAHPWAMATPPRGGPPNGFARRRRWRRRGRGLSPRGELEVGGATQAKRLAGPRHPRTRTPQSSPLAAATSSRRLRRPPLASRGTPRRTATRGRDIRRRPEERLARPRSPRRRRAPRGVQVHRRRVRSQRRGERRRAAYSRAAARAAARAEQAPVAAEPPRLANASSLRALRDAEKAAKHRPRGRKRGAASEHIAPCANTAHSSSPNEEGEPAPPPRTNSNASAGGGRPGEEERRPMDADSTSS